MNNPYQSPSIAIESAEIESAEIDKPLTRGAVCLPPDGDGQGARALLKPALVCCARHRPAEPRKYVSVYLAKAIALLKAGRPAACVTPHVYAIEDEVGHSQR